MLSDSTDLLRCKQLIEEKLGWGTGSTWTSADFDNLQQRVLEATGVSLSASTLRRIWGRVDYQHLPSATTLNTLARFAGYPDWRLFVQAQALPVVPLRVGSSLPTQPVPALPPPRPGNWRRLGWLVGLVLASILLGVVAFQQRQRLLPTGQYHFSSRPVTRTIPNSVIFTYDASAAPTDSVYIQQSWDPARRKRVARNGTTHTAIYYEPGYYLAQLVVAGQVVQKQPLLIPTQGWLGAIMTSPVPTYVAQASFVGKDKLCLPAAGIEQYNVALQPQTPLVQYYNVGNFAPVPLAHFAFSSDLKNEYSLGAAACQLSRITLVTTEEPIVIPLSAKGCVSELTLVDGVRPVSGKTTDLSAFGVDFSNWVHVTCQSEGRTIQYLINGKLAYTSLLPARKATIVGVIYSFRGTGMVKNITLQNGSNVVFRAF